jgi:hypothetical protein
MSEIKAATFLIHTITIDTFDKKLNGINETVLSIKPYELQILSTEKKTFSDKLREFALHLLDTPHVEVEKEALYVHVKTNVQDNISLSCLIQVGVKSGAAKRSPKAKSKR